ncbi:hypothetical protein VTO42DRAFT_4227 [Malbranchea cinnamomea]
MSAILSADDLNDFISPGVACIKPVETLPAKKNQDENSYEVTTEDKVAAENLPPAQISLTDCLACSGCVTSAEAVLVSLQSHAEVLNTLDSYPEIRTFDNLRHGEGKTKGSCKAASCNGTCNTSDSVLAGGKVFVASVSPQVRASIAATYGISQREAGYLIEQFLSGPQGLRAGGKHGSGFTWVVDTNVMRQAVLELTNAEVSEVLGRSETAIPSSAEFPPPARPVLSSACPGWICYAEKTHPHVLPHLSRLKSPQALTGTLLKTVLSRTLHIPPSRIWHLAIMPCFDKKLEASRQELTDLSWETSIAKVPQDPVRDVDCVITARELLTLATSRNISLKNLPLKPVPSSHITPFPDQILSNFLFPPNRHSSYNNQPPASGPSGGYLHHLLTTHQSLNPGSTIHTQRGRNADVIEFTLTTAQGEPILKTARYYGFRNIQNLVRKLKPMRASKLPGARPVAAASRRAGVAATASGAITDYAYVEVMACPGGCTNGGGQIRLEDAREVAAGNATSSDQQHVSQKPTLHEQRAWLARVDEAYYSAESEDEPEDAWDDSNQRQPDISSVLSHWSNITNIPLPKLVYTTFRKVESDVGKKKEADTARVAELAGKIGGGW